MEEEKQRAIDAFENAPKCNWFTAIFTLGIDCIIKAKAKMRAEKMAQRISRDKTELENTLNPLVKRIDEIKDIGTILLKAGKRKLEAVNTFLVAITAAESYFKNGGKLFHKAARKKHMKKLDELIGACDLMYEESEKDMEIFKVFLTSGADF